MQAIDTYRDQLRTVMADLSTMSPAMAGTEWHLDRVDEARFLVRQIERLEAQAK